jgi:hypothetical protein
MPNFTALTLTDRGAVTHLFNPRVEEANGVFRFTKAGANGVPVGESHLRVSLRETPATYKVRLKLDIPVVQTETINGIDNPKVVRNGVADVTFTFARTSSTAERELIVGLLANALLATQTNLDSVITDLENFA